MAPSARGLLRQRLSRRATFAGSSGMGTFLRCGPFREPLFHPRTSATQVTATCAGACTISTKVSGKIVSVYDLQKNLFVVFPEDVDFLYGFLGKPGFDDGPNECERRRGIYDDKLTHPAQRTNEKAEGRVLVMAIHVWVIVLGYLE